MMYMQHKCTVQGILTACVVVSVCLSVTNECAIKAAKCVMTPPMSRDALQTVVL